MAEEKEEKSKPVKQVVPAKGVIDLTEKVKMEILVDDERHHYKKGDEIEVSPTLAAKIEKNSWGKRIAMIALFLAFVIGASAQRNLSGANFYSPYTTGTAITAPYIDSVVNTGTAVLSVQKPKTAPNGTTVIQCKFVISSGSGTGTATVQGSLDGIGWNTVPAAVLTTATYAVTNTPATQYAMFAITGNPLPFYRISTLGVGTVVIIQSAKIYGSN